MTIVSSLICPNCGELYNDSTHRPCIGKCHHSICLRCKNRLKYGRCPICNVADTFKETVYNHQTVNFLADFQKSLSEKDFEQVVKDLENLGHGACSKCNSESRKLRVCTDCTPVLCHRQMSLETKCLAICANCAVDEHEGHEIVLLTSVPFITDHIEWNSVQALAAIVRSNEELGKESVRVPSKYENYLRQHKYTRELRESDLEIRKIISTGCPIWDGQLKESYEKLAEATKKLEDGRQFFEILMKSRLEHDHESCQNQEALVGDLKEILEFLKDPEAQTLSSEDFKKLDNELIEIIEQGVRDLEKEYVDKDDYFLKCQLIKNHIKTSKETLWKRWEEYEKSCEDYRETRLQNLEIQAEQMVKGLFYIDSSVLKFKNTPEYHEYNEKLVNSVLNNDAAMIHVLNAHFDTFLTSILVFKSFPVPYETPMIYEYLQEIDDVRKEFRHQF